MSLDVYLRPFPIEEAPSRETARALLDGLRARLAEMEKGR